MEPLQAHSACLLARIEVAVRSLEELGRGCLHDDAIYVIIRVVRAVLARFSSLLANPASGLSDARLR